MSDWQRLEQRFTDGLRLSRRPVAVAFLEHVPAKVLKFSGSEPSGCSFWRLAADGHVFYTVPADHYNCAVGSYTHNIPLPPERAPEMEQTLGFMFTTGYLRTEEVSRISQLPSTPRAIVYSPLGKTPVDPSLVLFVVQPMTGMLLNEAAMRAGATANVPSLGRPTCMALPTALAEGTVTSMGCISNRVYTDLGDDELYMVVPGPKLAQVAECLDPIVSANDKLAEYARKRRQDLSSSNHTR